MKRKLLTINHNLHRAQFSCDLILRWMESLQRRRSNIFGMGLSGPEQLWIVDIKKMNVLKGAKWTIYST